jgi:hypothetical protein
MPASRFAAWAGTHARSGVTRVTRVTLSANPNISAALGNAAEVPTAQGRGLPGLPGPHHPWRR